MSLIILISCNQRKEISTPEGNDFEEIPVQKTIKPLAEETENNIEVIKAIIKKAVENNNLEELQTFLETKAVKDNRNTGTGYYGNTICKY